MIKKRAQGWGLDLIIGLVIFFVGIVAFLLYTLNYGSGTEETIKEMTYDANVISDSLLSEGYPTDWNNLPIANVIAIGLTTDNRINQTKLETFYALSSIPSGYLKTKSLFNTNYDYFFNFSEAITVGGTPIFPQTGIGIYPTNANNVFRITRLTIYKNKPVTMNVYVWS